MDQNSLLDDFFDAIAAGDIDAVGDLYTDDVQVWHNVTDRALDHDGSLALLRYYVRTVDERHYEILARHHWDGGAVQRHVLHGRVGETVMRAPVCLTFAFRDGRISAIHEYVDEQAIAPMLPARA
jgi:ketosteroid isomerase-like protein